MIPSKMNLRKTCTKYSIFLLTERGRASVPHGRRGSSVAAAEAAPSSAPRAARGHALGPGGGQSVGRAGKRAPDRPARLARQRRLFRPAGAAAVGAAGGARPAGTRPLGGAAADGADFLAGQHLHAALPAAQAGPRARLHRGPRRRRPVGPAVRRPLPGARRAPGAAGPETAGAVRRARRPNGTVAGRRAGRAPASGRADARAARAAGGRLPPAWFVRGGRPSAAAALGAQGRRRRLHRRHRRVDREGAVPSALRPHRGGPGGQRQVSGAQRGGRPGKGHLRDHPSHFSQVGRLLRPQQGGQRPAPRAPPAA